MTAWVARLCASRRYRGAGLTPLHRRAPARGSRSLLRGTELLQCADRGVFQDCGGEAGPAVIVGEVVDADGVVIGAWRHTTISLASDIVQE